MSRRLTSIAILLTLTALVAARGLATNTAESLIVHEWGTFTSIAGADGRAVEWRPLDQPPDLPCFVDRFRFNLKTSLPGKVRMETPVLYFYTPRDTSVNVNVRFHRGAVTEWFPRAAVTPGNVDALSLRHSDFSSSISWTDVKLSPGASDDFPIDGTGSHYYAARRTDASPLQSRGQREKFLFYRGVGAFEPPLNATIAADGRVAVESSNSEAIGDVILFRNDGGAIAWEVRYGLDSRATFDSLSDEGEITPPHVELAQMLMSHGLYSREAQAMIDTWRDLWFGEGTRLFYIVPRTTIDSILPLDINPNPTEIVRVFVGRIELDQKGIATGVQRAAVTGCRR